MADAVPELDDGRKSAGKLILDLTDRFSFDALAAGWVYVSGSDRWLYFLVTPMLRNRGPSWIYERLMRIFKHHPLPAGISPLDVCIMDPEMETSAFGREFVAFDERDFPQGVGAVFSQPITLRDSFVDGGVALFYRRLPAALRTRQRDATATFAKRVDHLLAA